tara:strand:- start:365 stop:2224 length:1860 start_codon:yes stop_codon:yes gene_type:complete
MYNKNHTIMLNGTGLLGHTSSAQSSIIIKKPGSTIIYYIFTVDGVSGNAGGLNYSEVDMTLDGGLGDINSNKNIPIFSNACEKVTAVKHQNGTDLWVVSRLENSNTYHSYLLTSMGLNTTPVINNIGQVYNGSLGYLKASSDGSKVAAANKFGVATVDIMDFNNLTGILSNLITINHSGGLGPYGIEFSSNNNILYFSDFSCLYQVNLLAGSVTNIINSVISLGCVASPSALQMAPDQKIYIANENSTFLGVISNPDILGSGSNVNITSINLTPASSGLGLPTFFSSIFVSTNNFSFNNPCYGDSAFFNISNMSIDSVLWDFGDPNSGTSNSSANINPFHIFSDTGTFHISLYSYFNGITDTATNDLFVTDLPVVNLGNDTVICDGEILTLEATVQNATYLWQDNSANSTYDVIDVGNYFVEVTANGCSSTDTIHVIYNPFPNAIISGNHEVCDGDPVFINVLVTGASPFEITYTNGAETNIVSGNNPIMIEASQAGIYTITNVVDQFGCIGSYSGSSEVIINTCSLTVFIPNSFTPDNDLKNEGFIPSMYDINDVVTFNMIIFNRWGDIIYKTTKKDEYWDGKFNNTIVQQGVYAYTITITDIYEKLYNFNGYVYLIR